MIKAKKSLGQNFLIDQNIIDQIMDIVHIKDKNILKVGPSTGNLTSAILNNESVDLEINVSCNDSVDKISFNSTFLLNSNNLFNSYKIQANQWLKKEQ